MKKKRTEVKRARTLVKVISILVTIVVIWFFLCGIRLIGYFSAISERGIRATECGTRGCSDSVFFLNMTWTFSFFIVPLIIPVILVIYWGFKELKNTSS